MDRRPAVGAWLRRFAVLAAAACCLLPTRGHTQIAPPPAPQQLTGSLTYHYHLTGSAGSNDTYVEDLTATFTGIQMKLDSSFFPAAAHYEVQSYSVTISGTYDEVATFPGGTASCPVNTFTRHIDYTNAAGGTKGGRGQLDFTLPCGQAGVHWSFPITEKETDRQTCGPAIQPGAETPSSWTLPAKLPGSVPGVLTGSVLVGGSKARVDFEYTSEPPHMSLPSPDPAATGSYTWTESLQGTLTGDLPAGAQAPKPVDLEIPALTTLGLDKDKDGGLVILHITAEDDPELGDNMAPRMPITLSGCSGKVELKDPGPKVKIYTQPTGGAALKFDGKDNVFDGSALSPPKQFYVEGVEASDEMRDVRIVAELQGVASTAQAGGGGGSQDVLPLTVVGAYAPTVKDTMMSEHNAASEKPFWKDPKYYWDASDEVYRLANVKALNLLWYKHPSWDSKDRYGYGVEGRAQIRPNAFHYGLQNSPFKMVRDTRGLKWYTNDATANVAEDALDASEISGDERKYGDRPPLPWNDTPESDPVNNQDTDPAPDNAIYSLDAPAFALDRQNPTQSARLYNHIERFRANFRTYAVCKLDPPLGDGQWHRCSYVTRYWIGWSFIQKGRLVPLHWLDPNTLADEGLRLFFGRNVMGGMDYRPWYDTGVPSDNKLELGSDTHKTSEKLK